MKSPGDFDPQRNMCFLGATKDANSGFVWILKIQSFGMFYMIKMEFEAFICQRHGVFTHHLHSKNTRI